MFSGWMNKKRKRNSKKTLGKGILIQAHVFLTFFFLQTNYNSLCRLLWLFFVVKALNINSIYFRNDKEQIANLLDSTMLDVANKIKRLKNRCSRRSTTSKWSETNRKGKKRFKIIINIYFRTGKKNHIHTHTLWERRRQSWVIGTTVLSPSFSLLNSTERQNCEN